MKSIQNGNSHRWPKMRGFENAPSRIQIGPGIFLSECCAREIPGRPRAPASSRSLPRAVSAMHGTDVFCDSAWAVFPYVFLRCILRCTWGCIVHSPPQGGRRFAPPQMFPFIAIAACHLLGIAITACHLLAVAIPACHHPSAVVERPGRAPWSSAAPSEHSDGV